jgi:GntR family transcriptional regulator / MocR family aminotransferase
MLLPIVIDKVSAVSLQDQLSDQLRKFILDGVLAPGTRVATSRELARQFGISRNTVTLSYERLIGEGYLLTRPASGTFVAEVLPSGDAAPSSSSQHEGGGSVPRRPTVFRGQSLPRPFGRFEFDFGLGSADPSLFPTREWRRHILSVLDHHGGRMGNPQPPAGEPKLRHAIARWLSEHRGIAATADDVLVVSGSQQAYNVATQLLLRPGDGVVVEAPCHMSAARVFEAAGASPLPVPVDERGIRSDLLPPGAVLAYLTPSHQNPVGGTLPLDRREQVLAWARDNGAYVFEDDIGCEFHYDGWQPPSLKSMDRDGLVIYCGSFSLTLGAGLRLGYMVLPPELAAAALCAKTLLDNGSPWLEQAALANLIDAGSFARHVVRLQKLFHERRDHLVEVLGRQFADAEVIGVEAGTHVGLLLPEDFPDAEAIRMAAAEQSLNLHVAPPSSFDAAADPRYRRHTVYLGYGALPLDRIEPAVDRLATVIGSVTPAFR